MSGPRSNSNRPGGPAGPSRPLIQRPQTVAGHTSSSIASSYPGARPSPLTNAIHGALGGMGYRIPPPAPIPMHYPQAPAYPAHPLPLAHAPQPNGLPLAPHLYYNAYPPSLPAPPIHPNHHPLPMNPHLYHQPPQPAPYHPGFVAVAPSSSPPHYALGPTTHEGYTLSSTYVGSTPTPSYSKPFPSTTTPKTTSSARNPSRPNSTPRPRSAAASHPSASTSYKCSHPDCPFSSNTRKTTREHEEDRHLIFEKGREPKPWKGTYQSGAHIEGTSVSLDSPEAVAQWIEQRKRRWPSTKVVEEKEKAREERVKAGLEAPSRGHEEYGRGRIRGRGRGRGGRGGRGAMMTSGRDAEGHQRKKVKLEDNNGSSSLSGDDDTSDESSSSGSSDSDEDGPPEAISSAKPLSPSTTTDVTTEATTKTMDDPRTPRVPCRHFLRGRCHAGNACTFLHSAPDPSTAPRVVPTRKRPAPPSTAPANPFARVDPFDQLAERDWKHLVSDVLQVVEFLSRNDWLRGVEMRRGQVEEEGGVEVMEVGKVREEKGRRDEETGTVLALEGEELESNIKAGGTEKDEMEMQAVGPVDTKVEGQLVE